MKATSYYSSTKSILATALLSLSVASGLAFGQTNLVNNGNFSSEELSGWNVITSAAPNTSTWESLPSLESEATNLAHPSGLSFTPGVGVAVNINDYAFAGTPSYDTLYQGISGLTSAAALNGGDLTVYFDVKWSNGAPPVSATITTASLDLFLGDSFLFNITTSHDDGIVGTLSAGAGILFDAGTASTTTLDENTWTRYALTLPGYSGADTQDLAFRFSTLDDAVGGANDDFMIDNVVISSGVVPEPSSALLALLGIRLIARRRRVS